MKRLAVILSIMGLGVYLLLSEKDKKRVKSSGRKGYNKFKKSHFPGKDIAADVE
jgi:hypothetical protein